MNDYVFLDSNQNGIVEIVLIDHGREVTGEPLGTSKLHVYEWNGAQFIDRTDQTSGNTPAYNHNSSGSADLNGDGLLDFPVATISSSSKIFYGDSQSIFRLGVEYSFEEFGSTGASGVLKNEGTAVFLPYDTWDADADFDMAEFVKNGVVTRQDARTGVLPSNYGYSFIQTADINNDGRTDFVALAESPSLFANGRRVFVTFIQKNDGTFEIFNSFPNESQITDSKMSPGWLGVIWSEHKFSLFDINGDGKLDLFWGSVIDSTPGDLKFNLFYGDGTGNFSRNEVASAELFKDVSWQGGARTAVDDINKDGLGDLIVFQEFNGSITPIVFLNKGN